MINKIRRAVEGRHATTSVAAELRDEVDKAPSWMYAWQLAPEITTPVLGPELPDIHRTRLELIERAAREALREAGPEASAIDLACNEGWFSHRLLELGASRVVGVDIRPRVIKRAQLVRDHFRIPAGRLDFRCDDVFNLSESTLGKFDVVLCLGLVYHLENPVGALRVARSLTRRVCIIESQLTRQTSPIVLGNGRTEQYEERSASFAALLETDQDENMLASSGGVLSFVPNRAALELAVTAAGFDGHEWVEPAPTHNRQYILGDRGVLVAHVKKSV